MKKVVVIHLKALDIRVKSTSGSLSNCTENTDTLLAPGTNICPRKSDTCHTNVKTQV